MRGVCGAGLATTVVPVTSAATVCPRKIASGKFQGAIVAHTPLPSSRNVFRSPVGPGSSTGDSVARACAA